MAYIFRTTTNGLGRASLEGCQDRWEEPPPYPGDEDGLDLDTATNVVIEVIGRACRTFDKAAARDLLREAAAMLETLADQVENGEVTL